MKPSKFLICALSYLIFGALVVEGFLGMNWGRMATQRMIPSMVADMMMQNNISDVKVYSASDNVLEAFGGTGINLAIAMPNQEIKNMNATNYTDVWIDVNVNKFSNMNVSFRYIYIGAEPYSPTFFNATYVDAVDVLRNMQMSLKNQTANGNTKLAGVKATMSHYTDILDQPITIPSKAEFRAEVKDQMVYLCTLLKYDDAPFAIDIFPLVNVQEFFNNDTEFAFFENNSTSKFKDGEYFYNNVFEVMYDSVVCAMEKVGFLDIPIIVGEIGWPTDGIVNGNLQNAERFYQGLTKFMRNGIGTPRRPGNIDMYMHNLADENAINKIAGPFMRHWGIYKFDGEPKFNIDLEGYQREIMPVSAIGITHMPRRWCVLDTSRIDLTQPQKIPFNVLDAYYNESCTKADCTAMSPGGSCSGLQFPLNYSYAFNIAFQSRSQDPSACNYGRYGVIATDDLSTRTCTFPVEILSAETPNFYGLGRRSHAFAIRPSMFTSFTALLYFLFILFNFSCRCSL